MSKNCNEQSQRIVRSWFKRAKEGNESYNYFDRFISLWISFNCFFIAEHYEEVSKNTKSRNPSEKDFIDFIVKNERYKNIYLDLVKNSGDMKKAISEFLELLCGDNHITSFRGRIKDMRPNHQEEKYATEFTDINNFNQFVHVVYQVRCNLFHGNKDPDKDDDEQVVEKIFRAFLIFLEKLYNEENCYK